MLTFYQRDPVYSLGLASLSAYARREIGDLRVHLVPIFHWRVPHPARWRATWAPGPAT